MKPLHPGGTMCKLFRVAMIGVIFLLSSIACAANYKIDVQSANTSIQFKVRNVGLSWIHGYFRHFSGEFSFDPNNPDAAKISVEIDPSSIDSEHAERDKHLRGKRFLNVAEFPSARFIGKKVTLTGAGNAKVIGDLSLKGVTKEITIDAHLLNTEANPWASERVGFKGSTRLELKDFNILRSLGPLSQEIDMTLTIEGLKQ